MAAQAPKIAPGFFGTIEAGTVQVGTVHIFHIEADGKPQARALCGWKAPTGPGHTFVEWPGPSAGRGCKDCSRVARGAS